MRKAEHVGRPVRVPISQGNLDEADAGLDQTPGQQQLRALL